MKRLVAAVLALLICTACGEKQVKQVQEADVVYDYYGGYDRPEKIVSFLKNVEDQIKDQILLISKTDESDPIITELVFDGEAINYRYDTRLDRYGSGEVTEKRCKPEFTRVVQYNSIEYSLETCYGTSGVSNVFLFDKK